MVVDPADIGKNQRMGNPDNDAIIPSSKTNKDETWVDYHTGTCNMARKIRVQMALQFL